jgi:vacuolar-type H+-ATPase subunit I/STV1
MQMQQQGVPQSFESAEDNPAGERHGKMSPKAIGVITSIREDIRSLSSSVLIITQKMKYLVRNEKILGRNLLVLNKKIKTLEERISSGEIGAGSSLGGSDVQGLLAKLEENNKKISELQAQLTQLQEGTASQEQLQELKYIIDSINPLEFATVRQVKELIEQAIEKIERKNK